MLIACGRFWRPLLAMVALSAGAGRCDGADARALLLEEQLPPGVAWSGPVVDSVVNGVPIFTRAISSGGSPAQVLLHFRSLWLLSPGMPALSSAHDGWLLLARWRHGMQQVVQLGAGTGGATVGFVSISEPEQSTHFVARPFVPLPPGTELLTVIELPLAGSSPAVQLLARSRTAPALLIAELTRTAARSGWQCDECRLESAAAGIYFTRQGAWARVQLLASAGTTAVVIVQSSHGELAP